MNNDKRASTDSIIAATNKAKQAQECKLGNCSRTLHIGLFFDGVGRNKDLDEPNGKLSNIAKLFYAYKNAEEITVNNDYWKFYISGLGTPYNEVNNSERNYINTNLNDEFQSNIQDSIRDTSLEAGVWLRDRKRWL
ncbi:DUF2235 domain-containing protein [Providencia stuartii]|nr:DUF2235 domain-containing protein [Providencia stuartii]MDK7738134.1 DUF2235 domain-containing protein [Providencia stuartii]MDN7223396.1 DUF2235 domain-containing protein [Providencia stuartii]MDQ5991806.1 hypothetical protein [Providencia stuartii]